MLTSTRARPALEEPANWLACAECARQVACAKRTGPAGYVRQSRGGMGLCHVERVTNPSNRNKMHCHFASRTPGGGLRAAVGLRLSTTMARDGATGKWTTGECHAQPLAAGRRGQVSHNGAKRAKAQRERQGSGGRSALGPPLEAPSRARAYSAPAATRNSPTAPRIAAWDWAD